MHVHPSFVLWLLFFVQNFAPSGDLTDKFVFLWHFLLLFFVVVQIRKVQYFEEKYIYRDLNLNILFFTCETAINKFYITECLDILQFLVDTLQPYNKHRKYISWIIPRPIMLDFLWIWYLSPGVSPQIPFLWAFKYKMTG